MPNKKHHIKLTSAERTELGAVARKRNAAVAKVQRARALLAVDIGPEGPALPDLEASAGSGLTTRSIQRLRARACEVGPLGALERKPRDHPPVPPKVTGEVEAGMIKIACADPPEGRNAWTLNLIAGTVIELGLVESISGETVRVTLKKTTSNPGRKSAGASRRNRTRPS
jgi:putative transposase